MDGCLFSLSEVSGNLDVWCPVSQEKENLSALERKYADLTGGRSFTLREVGFSSGRPLSLKAPQDSEGGDGCGTFFLLNKKNKQKRAGFPPLPLQPGSFLIGRRLSVLQRSPARRSSSSFVRLVLPRVPLFLRSSEEGRGSFPSCCSCSLLLLPPAYRDLRSCSAHIVLMFRSLLV